MRSNPQLPRLKSVIGKDGVVVLINLIKNEKSLHEVAARPVSKGHFKKVFVELKKRFPQNQLYSQQVWTCWINIKQNYRYHRSNYWAPHLGFIERFGQKNASAQAHPEQPSVLDSSHVSLAPQMFS
ncbi:hypothetical protein L596_014063 [Steinernema carpocapsae]|uniref:Uncharacterized protein n=1 Tax=Steinernema carpocapsae TaxID=34508 RepID=A0A4U5NBR6_STECR|nr:hypothetical protein L596_014063 [Steinernema carpocapsae]